MLRFIPGLFLILIISAGCRSGAKNQQIEEKQTTAYLGILYTGSERGGVVIMEVFQNSPAEKAELNVGDRILAVNGRSVAGVLTMRDQIQAMKPGTVITLDVVKIDADQTEKKVKIKLDKIPDKLPPGRYYSE